MIKKLEDRVALFKKSIIHVIWFYRICGLNTDWNHVILALLRKREHSIFYRNTKETAFVCKCISLSSNFTRCYSTILWFSFVNLHGEST